MRLSPRSNRDLSIGVKRRTRPASAFYLWNFGNGWEFNLALSRTAIISGIYVSNIWQAEGPAVPVVAWSSS
jgi:hypothetical protein